MDREYIRSFLTEDSNMDILWLVEQGYSEFNFWYNKKSNLWLFSADGVSWCSGYTLGSAIDATAKAVKKALEDEEGYEEQESK